MKKLFTRFGKFAIVLIALDLAVAITIIACSALFLTGCGDEYILDEEDVDAALPPCEVEDEEEPGDEDEEETEEEIRERELAELAAFEPYIDDEGMVHVSPWFAYPLEVVEGSNAAVTIEDPRKIVYRGYVYILVEEELIEDKLTAIYRLPCDSDQQCYEALKIYIYKCLGKYTFSPRWGGNDVPTPCPEEGRY